MPLESSLDKSPSSDRIRNAIAYLEGFPLISGSALHPSQSKSHRVGLSVTVSRERVCDNSLRLKSQKYVLSVLLGKWDSEVFHQQKAECFQIGPHPPSWSHVKILAPLRNSSQIITVMTRFNLHFKTGCHWVSSRSICGPGFLRRRDTFAIDSGSPWLLPRSLHCWEQIKE